MARTRRRELLWRQPQSTQETTGSGRGRGEGGATAVWDVLGWACTAGGAAQRCARRPLGSARSLRVGPWQDLDRVSTRGRRIQQKKQNSPYRGPNATIMSAPRCAPLPPRAASLSARRQLLDGVRVKVEQHRVAVKEEADGEARAHQRHPRQRHFGAQLIHLRSVCRDGARFGVARHIARH